MDPAAVQVPSEIPRIINDLSPAGRLVPLAPALKETLNADLPLGIVRREALAAVLPILSALKEASETNPLSKKIDPSADLPLEETLTVDLPLGETLIVDLPLGETLIVDLPLGETLIVDLPLGETLTVDLPLEEILTADLPLAAALRVPNVLRVVSGADPSRGKRAHPDRSPVFLIMPVKRHPRAAS